MAKNKLNNSVTKKEQTKEMLVQKTNNMEQVGDSPVADIDNSSANAFLWLLVFSVLMFTFPFLTFYGVRSWLQESFDFNTFQTNCFSVLASVLVVNFIICLYVYKAFTERVSSSSSSSTNSDMANGSSEIKKND